jgi:hypothetical protein
MRELNRTAGGSLLAFLGWWAVLPVPAWAGGDQAAEAVQHFQKAWKPQKGYMRPADGAGWKARLEGFQRLARLGDKAVPALTEALAKGEPATRVFAAQALVLLASPNSRPALTAALKNPLRSLRDKDRNRDVRSHAAFALERDDQPQPAVVPRRCSTTTWPVWTATRLGKPAPDFTLTDALGKKHKLRDLRGKKAVVLVFVYGDT